MTERYFPTLKDFMREIMTPNDWERIFGGRTSEKSKRTTEKSNREKRHP